MRNIKVSDILSKRLISVHPKQSVKEAADLFAKENITGAPVVDDSSKLIGVVSDTDLVMQDVRFHFPTFIHLLDSFVFLQSFNRFETELKKAVGAKVEDVMTKDVITATKENTVEDIATLMVEKNVDRIPIIEENRVVGIVTKGDIVKLISRS